MLNSQNPSAYQKMQEELDTVLGGRNPTMEDVKNLKYLTRCINESMRLYPHPPVRTGHLCGSVLFLFGRLC